MKQAELLIAFTKCSNFTHHIQQLIVCGARITAQNSTTTTEVLKICYICHPVMLNTIIEAKIAINTTSSCTSCVDSNLLPYKRWMLKNSIIPFISARRTSGWTKCRTQTFSTLMKLWLIIVPHTFHYKKLLLLSHHQNVAKEWYMTKDLGFS